METERKEIVLAPNPNEPVQKIPKKIKTFSVVPEDKRKGFAEKEFLRSDSYYRRRQKIIYYNAWRFHPWVKAFVNKIAKVALTVGWNIKFIGEGVADKQVLNAVNNFFRYPNYKESFDDILVKTIIQIKLFAEAFWEVVKSEDGYPEDFYSLDGYIEPRVDEHGQPLNPAFVQYVQDNTAEFCYDEVLWFKLPDPMGSLNPKSEFEGLEYALNLDFNALALNKRKQSQGVHKGKLYIFPMGTGREVMEANRAEIKALHEGVQGSYSPAAAIEGECTIQDIAVGDEDMVGSQLRKFNISEMSAVIGTPLAKVGLSGSTELEVKEGNFVTKGFFDEEIKPILSIIQDTVNRYFDLIGMYDYRFVFKNYPSRDLKEISRLVDVLRKNGICTINEAREMVGLDPIQGGDVAWLQLREGTIIVTTEIAEAMKEMKERKDQEQSGAVRLGTYNFGSRKITRVEQTPEADFFDEEGEVLEKEEGIEEEVNPFV